VVKGPPPPFIWKVRVPSHWASSDAVPSGERACSLVASVCPCSSGASERPAAQPRNRRTAHPSRKAATIAMWCLWRTTAHPPSLCRCPPLLTPRSMPHDKALRISTEAYSSKLLEGRCSANFACIGFCELRAEGVLGSSATGRSRPARRQVRQRGDDLGQGTALPRASSAPARRAPERSRTLLSTATSVSG
jgi:hypothetical protein